MSEEKETNENRSSKLLVGMLVVLLVVMFSSGFFIYKLVLANPTNTEKQVTEVGPMYETEEFLVNLSGSVNHYIKARFALELSDKKVVDELGKKLPLLKDTVIMILANKTVDDLDAQGKEDLKLELIKEINKFLDQGKVLKIHYLAILLT